MVGINGGTSPGYELIGTALDVWLIKTDSKGVEEWNRTFGGQDVDLGVSVLEASDGGYVAVGMTESYGAGGIDAWLIKTDSAGNEEWNRTFGGPGSDGGESVQVTEDGGYLIVGSTQSYGAGGGDAWIIKTDSSGEEEWNRTFGGPKNDGGDSVQQTDDGGYIIAGNTISYGAGGRDAWLIKTDSSGREEWNRTFGGPGYDWGQSVCKTEDSGYIIAGWAGWTLSCPRDLWLIRTDSVGDEEWNKTFGGPQHDAASSVQVTDDSGYFIVGWTESFGSGSSDVWLIKTDRNGTEEWNRTIGWPGFDEAISGQETNDGGYIICGTTDSNSGSIIFAPRDAWLIKLAPTKDEELNETIDISISRTLTVGLDGHDYAKIQDAIDAARPGDTIEVHSGIYSENVNVTKRLNLLGIGMPMADAGEKGNGITLIADGIRLMGFEVRNSSKSSVTTDGGIVVMSKDNVIEGNNASYNLNGILLIDSSRNLLKGNNVSHNKDSGILLRKSRFNTITANEACYNRNGILIEHSSNENVIEYNSASENQNGMGVDYSHANKFVGNNVVNNTYGITVWSSNANILYGNNMENIEFDAYEDSISNMTTDQWDNGIIGNRYGDFDCSDADEDGICDCEYEIQGGLSVDRYPLARWPWAGVDL